MNAAWASLDSSWTIGVLDPDGHDIEVVHKS